MNVIEISKSESLINEYRDYYNRINANKFTRKNDKLAIKDTHTNFLVVLVKCLSSQLNKRFAAKSELTSEAALTVTKFHSYFAKDSKGRIDKDKRTIRRYLDRLHEAGFINYYRDDYGYANIKIHPDLIRFSDKFEVLITPVLCGFFETEPEKLQKFQHADIQPLFLGLGERLSPKPITGNNKKQSFSDVENPRHGNTAQDKPELNEITTVLSGNMETIELETRKAVEKNSESQLPRPKNLKEYSELRRRAVQQKETRTSLVNRLVIFLWSYVIQNFYRPQYPYFDESQEKIVLNFFHDQFLTVPDHRIKEVYESLHSRNKRWHKFLKKNTDRFTPLPGKFFDLNNAKGYQITKNWINADKKKQFEISARNQVDHQLREAKKMLEGKHTVRGKHLTLKERLYYTNQITANVEQLANHYNRPDLLHSYSRRLQDHIDKNPLNL